MSWLSAIAEGSRSGGTSRGMADDRAGWSTADRPAAAKATANSAATGGSPDSARTTSTRLQAARPTWVDHQQPPPVHGVGERAGPEREQQDRHQLEERQRRDRQGRPGQDVDLEWQARSE